MELILMHIAEAWRRRTVFAKLASFASIGIVNVAVDVTFFTFLYKLLNFPLIVSNILAWAIAVTGSYAMNSKITFGRETGGDYTWIDYRRFVASGMFGMIMASITLVLICQYASVPLAKLASIAVAFGINFSISHFVVFRRSAAHAGDD